MTMRAIVIKQYGGPDVLHIEERPTSSAHAGQVLIQVKAFGINQAEIYFRQGKWGEVAEISGIECVGLVVDDPSGAFMPGQKVMALVGGMGRSLNGSYAEYAVVPASNVVAIESGLPWSDLAALPATYATAWTCLMGNLAVKAGQTVLIRGATSALGQAAVNLANHAGAHVLGTTRSVNRIASLEALGVREVLIETADLHRSVLERHANGIDAVLDLVGTTTVLDSLSMVRRGGHVCAAGFLGGGGPMERFDPVFQIPSGRYLSVFASALVLGGRDYPLTGIPFQQFVDRAAEGAYLAKPARVFEFDGICEAHRLVESGQANGKVVVRL
jgi:NADPH2:quinone reductase